MAKKKRLPGKLVRLTKTERQTIIHALRIAGEDGSLGDEGDALVDPLTAKLK